MVNWTVLVWSIVLSFFFGGFTAVFTIAAMQVASKADDEMEQWLKEKQANE